MSTDKQANTMLNSKRCLSYFFLFILSLQLFFIQSVFADQAMVNVVRPAPESVLTQKLTVFQWQPNVGIISYEVKIGSTPGGDDISASKRYNGHARAVPIEVELNGQPVYVTLKASNRTDSEEYIYEYQTATDASGDDGDEITSVVRPAPGSTLTKQLTVFQWDKGYYAGRWIVKVGRTPGGDDILASRLYNGYARAIPIDIELDGRPVYVTLTTILGISGGTYTRTYEYQTATSGDDGDELTQVVRPAPGSTLTKKLTVFQWEKGYYGGSWFAKVGRTPGGDDILANRHYNGYARAIPIDVELDGRPVYVTLTTILGNSGGTYTRTYEYQTATSGDDGDELTQVVRPAPGSTLTKKLTVFQWEKGYYGGSWFAKVGRTPGGDDILANRHYNGYARAIPIDVELDGRPVYVTLTTILGNSGGTYTRTYEYQTATSGDDGPITQLVAPVDKISTDPFEIRWQPGDSATSYYLQVGSTEGGGEYYSRYLGWHFRSVDISNIPLDGQTVYIKLHTQVGRGAWYSRSYEFIAQEDLPPLSDADSAAVVHYLNRLAYGPTKPLLDELTPGDGESFEQKLSQWVDDQFNTPGIVTYYEDGSSMTEKQRRVLVTSGSGYQDMVDLSGINLTDFADKFSQDLFIGSQSIWTALGYQTRFDELQNGLPRGGCQDNVYDYDSEAPALSFKLLRDCLKAYEIQCTENPLNDPAQCVRDANQGLYISNDEGIPAVTGNVAAVRPMVSSQQLRTRIGKFWDNHFTTNLESLDDRRVSARWAQKLYDQDTFFDNAFDNFFEDLLLRSASSPAMMIFLDGDTNTAEKPNENYAREVMELHTLGENEYYDQEDIYQLARILSGWQVARDSSGAKKLVPGRYKLYRPYYTSAPSGSERWVEFGGADGKDVFKNNWKLPGASAGDVPYDSGVWSYDFVSADHDDGTNGFGLDAEGMRIACSSLPEENSAYCRGNKVFLDFEIGVDTPKTNKPLVNVEQEAQGVFALMALAYHPRTAVFMCSKLHHTLVSDVETNVGIDIFEPTLGGNIAVIAPSGRTVSMPMPYGGTNVTYVVPANASQSDLTVKACAETFYANRGADDQMELVLRQLINSNEFNDTDTYRSKAKDTGEYAYSLFRLFGKPASELQFPHQFLAGYTAAAAGGYVPYIYPDPDGLPEISEEIQGISAIRQRQQISRLLPGTHWWHLPYNASEEYISTTAQFFNHAFRPPNALVEERQKIHHFFYNNFCQSDNCQTSSSGLVALEEDIAQFILTAVYGEVYTDADVALIKSLFSPGRHLQVKTETQIPYFNPLSDDALNALESKIVRYSNANFEGLVTNGNNFLPSLRAYILNVLPLVMANVPDYNLQ